ALLDRSQARGRSRCQIEWTLDIGDGGMNRVIRANPLIHARCGQLLQNAGGHSGPFQQAHLPTPESFVCRRGIVDHAGGGAKVIATIVSIRLALAYLPTTPAKGLLAFA